MGEKQGDWIKVRNLIEAFNALVPNAEHHLAHAVLSDYNLEDSFISDAIIRCDAEIDMKNDALITRKFLQFLLTIPEDQRTAYGD